MFLFHTSAGINLCHTSIHTCFPHPRACTPSFGPTTSSYHCSCPWGYTGPPSNCTDIDECRGSYCVVKREVCKNLNKPGAFHCECKAGFFNPYGYWCNNVNECIHPALNNCRGGTQCVDTFGSYYCTAKCAT